MTAIESAERTYKIIAPSGVHLRPAQVLVEAAQAYDDVEIVVSKDSLVADGKSILSLLSLGLAFDTEICIKVSGKDSVACLDAVEVAMKKEGLV
jgi:phosphotransferase system HPr (HPr) family protein